MKQFIYLLAALIIFSTGCTDFKRDLNDVVSEGIEIPVDGPIQLHPENPHYFLYNGDPLVLITSAEHYGALLNLDFDYKKYLAILGAEGMNYTRIFTGTYFEIPGESFSIKNNTLAPEKDRVITPWAIVIDDLSGDFKYDLSTWNDAYFERLRDLILVAADNNVIVEVTLFSSIYRDAHWDISPQNPSNNVNIKHEVNRFDAQTLNNETLMQYQERFVRKMVRELNAFDNFFFEIQNEPWADHPIPVLNIENKEDLVPGDWRLKSDFADEASMGWQRKIASIIVDEESHLDKKHLIAQNYTNFKAPIPEVDSNVSIMNFHYNWPEAVEWNYGHDKVVGFDESGFSGSGDQVYRRQAWRFILSGGGLFNNLDYSFFSGYENGTLVNEAPGGGSVTLRKQLNTLSDFIHGFDLVSLHPDHTSIRHSPGVIPYVLSDPGREYAIFLQAVTENSVVHMKIPEGNYAVKHLNTVNGEVIKEESIQAGGELVKLEIGFPEGEIAVSIRNIDFPGRQAGFIFLIPN
jgi:hypothetical protein